MDRIRQLPTGYPSAQNSEALFISAEIWNKLCLISWLLKWLFQMFNCAELTHHVCTWLPHNTLDIPEVYQHVSSRGLFSCLQVLKQVLAHSGYTLNTVE